ncbi:MAG: hypothetical protein KGO02_02330 [Alphaproteobacteria bacterium]|nr:hypothetical protein [Alphaproteobacteria bacterium]
MSAHTVEVHQSARLAPPIPADAKLASNPFDETDRLRPARAIANGLLLSVPFWLLLGFAIWILWF